MVRIQGTVIALAGRVQGRRLHVLIDSGSIGNYLSARCYTVLELEMRLDDEFERLTLADGSGVACARVHLVCLYCRNYKTRILARFIPNLHEELILGIPWLVKDNPTIDWATRWIIAEKNGTVYTLPGYR